MKLVRYGLALLALCLSSHFLIFFYDEGNLGGRGGGDVQDWSPLRASPPRDWTCFSILPPLLFNQIVFFLLLPCFSTCELETFQHCRLFQRNISWSNFLSLAPLETELASPSIPNFALTHAFAAPLPRFSDLPPQHFCNFCHFLISTYLQQLSSIWYHQLDTKSLLTFHMLRQVNNTVVTVSR